MNEYYRFGGATIYTPDGVCFLLNWPTLSWHGVPLYSPQPLQNWDPSFVVYYPNVEFVPSDCLAGQLPVFSPRLRQFFEAETPGCFQFLPLCLKRSDGTGEVKDYCLGHPLVAVDCLDRDRTVVGDRKWKKDRDGWYEIRYGLTLSRRLIGNNRVFIVDGYPIMLVVREDIKEAIERKGFTNCAFEKRELSN